MAKRMTELTEKARRVEQLIEELGVDREVAYLIEAVESGDAMVDDIVFDPPISDDEKRQLGLGIPIEERIAEARRQVRILDQRGGSAS